MSDTPFSDAIGTAIGGATLGLSTIVEQSLQQRDTYVVHGAQIACDCGSRTSRLIVPFGHGTNIHDMPQLTINDCKVGQNIQSFGFCFSEENPNRQAEIDKIMKAVKKDKGFFDGFMKFFGAKGLDNDDYADDVENNVLICCTPIIIGNSQWQEGTDKLLIGGVKTLLATCELHCKYGGIIQICTDGQEDAIQSQTTDMNIRNFTTE